MRCNNCNNILSCGCQKRVATDGKSVCSNCVTRYNAQLIKNDNAILENEHFTVSAPKPIIKTVNLNLK